MLQEPLTGLTLQQFLTMHCEAALLTRNINVDAVTAEVAKLSSQREVAAGHTLFTFGETPESFFLILKVWPAHGEMFKGLYSTWAAALDRCPHTAAAEMSTSRRGKEDG